MKWVPDSTGRFRWRPHYEQDELDAECERIVTQFLRQTRGEVRFPLSSDDLAVMIEKDTSDLDLYADLSVEGEDVEGLTEFFPDRKPAVKIARELSLDPLRLGRLRTTLAHEYGHVKFHSFLWDFSISKKSSVSVVDRIPAQRRRYEQFRKAVAFRSSRHSLHLPDASTSDWMEWQASYVSGAILMPLSFLRDMVRTKQEGPGSRGWLPGDSQDAMDLISRVAESFDVPDGTAKVRLEEIGFLQNEPSSALATAAPI